MKIALMLDKIFNLTNLTLIHVLKPIVIAFKLHQSVSNTSTHDFWEQRLLPLRHKAVLSSFYTICLGTGRSRWGPNQDHMIDDPSIRNRLFHEMCELSRSCRGDEQSDVADLFFSFHWRRLVNKWLCTMQS